MYSQPHYSGPIPLPGDLFGERRRSALVRVGADWPSLGRIGLPIDGARKDEAVALGAVRGDYNKISISRKEAVDLKFQHFVPFIAQRDFKPLLIEMIPESSFAASLYNLLAPQSWETLRRSAHHRASFLCEICGSGHKTPECHELWEYIPPKGKRKNWGVQHLRGLLSVCRECHEMFHPGLANLRGRGELVAKRLMKVNAWEMHELMLFANFASEVHYWRSGIKWALDVSSVQHLTEFIITPEWQDDGHGGLIATKDRYGIRPHTKLIGVEWRMADPEENAMIGAYVSRRSA